MLCGAGELVLSAEQEDLLFTWVETVPWPTGHYTRKVLSTLRWLRDVPPRRPDRKRAFFRVSPLHPIDKMHIGILYDSLICANLKIESKTLAVLLREESLLDAFQALMVPCPAGSMLTAEEPCRVLALPGEIALDVSQFDYLYLCVEKMNFPPSRWQDWFDTLEWLNRPTKIGEPNVETPEVVTA
jgi:hypothetical protein